MEDLLDFAKTAYITSHDLKPFLKDYTNPDDLLSRLVKSGKLIRLKNGFFLIAEKIEKSLVPYEQIANLLYGPSYISFEWALSFYGMILEGVYVVTSISTNRSKDFTTPVGTFDYTYLNHNRYAIGIDQKKTHAGDFLIASPEKALVDLIHFKSRHLEGKDLLVDLVEARRIEPEDLKNLNKKLIYEISEQYRSKTVKNLVNVLGLL